MSRHWSYRYCKLPYRDKGRGEDGCFDCWGLVRHVFANERGIQLPSFHDGYMASCATREVARAIQRGLEAEWRRIETPREYALVIFRSGSIPDHVGLMISRSEFLHISPAGKFNEGNGISVVRKLNSMDWKHRVWGFYEYVG